MTEIVDAGAATAVQVRGLTLAPARVRPILLDINLDIAAGERVLLVGPSGSGKSTLLRALAGLLVEEEEDGALRGEVLLDGHRARPGTAGLLLQDPLDAVVAATAGRDTAFGPENGALDRSGIWRQVHHAHRAAAFIAGMARDTATLSGGELQRLGLAGALALRPGLLLLDEPTSMLDQPTATHVRDAVIAAAAGTTLVVVDHDIQAWLGVVDRVIALGRDGTVVGDGPAARMFALPEVRASGLWLPGADPPQIPELPVELLRPARCAPSDGIALQGNTLRVVRRRRGLQRSTSATVLRDVDIALPAATVTALTGDSGAGKSTLVAVLAGLLRPTEGRLTAHATLAVKGCAEPWRWSSKELATRLGWVPQHPEHGFVRTSVREEVRATGRRLGLGAAGERRADDLLELMGLTGRAGLNPRLLSGGEQRRLSMASALAAGPAVLLADEPSVGQDRSTWALVAGLLRYAATAGVAVAVASHDERLVQRCSDETVRLVAGRLATPARRRLAEPVNR